MIIRETRKDACLSHDVLGRRMSSGQSRITCLELDLRPLKLTMLKAFLVVEHAFTLVDILEPEGRVV